MLFEWSQLDVGPEIEIFRNSAGDVMEVEARVGHVGGARHQFQKLIENTRKTQALIAKHIVRFE